MLMRRTDLASRLLAGLLGGLLVAAAASATIAQSETPAGSATSGSLTLEIRGLTGMEGLELVATVWGAPSDGELLRVPIDAPAFTTSGHVDLPPGAYYLWVLAGVPPCEAGFIPACGPGVARGQDVELADYFCMLDFDVQAGQRIYLGLMGLPSSDRSGDDAPCPVSYWLSQPPAAAR